MLAPRLLDGNTYPVMLHNLWRLLKCGVPMVAARQRVLTHAGADVFPNRPAMPPVAALPFRPTAE